MTDTTQPGADNALDLLPCPFCGSTNIDAAEWSGNDGASGPGCGDCGALADSAELWNRRAAQPVEAEGAPVDCSGDPSSCPDNEADMWKLYSEDFKVDARAALAAADALPIARQAQPTGENTERAAFEAWAEPRGYSMARTTNSYESKGTKSAWRGWWARARNLGSGSATEGAAS